MSSEVMLMMVGLSGMLIYGGYPLSCLDDNDNEVDWYTSYKVPRMTSKITLVEKGEAYFYLDLHNPKWTLSQTSITDKGQAISNTLMQIYSAKDKTFLHIMYNDERAKNLSFYPDGHTKGVVAFDNSSGFWLIHSVPKFPPPKEEGFEYPSTGLKYGQSFLCISFAYKQLGQIAKQLEYNQPNIYDQYIPPNIYNDFPILHNLSMSVQGPPWFSIETLVSKAGQSFISFAKSKQYQKDLYADLIAPTLKSDIYVETWQDGSGPILYSNCSIPYRVYNVEQIALPDGLIFRETLDHSKWATSFVNSKNIPHPFSKTIEMTQTSFWTCIGDINRKEPQKNKGGGSVCIHNEQVWRSYFNAVKTFSLCTSEMPVL